MIMLLESGGDGLKWIWLYCSLPFAGAIIGVSFHEFLYKKIHSSGFVDDEESEEETN